MISVSLLIALYIACLVTPKNLPASVWFVNSFTSLVWVFKTDTNIPSRAVVLDFILFKASGVKGLFFL